MSYKYYENRGENNMETKPIASKEPENENTQTSLSAQPQDKTTTLNREKQVPQKMSSNNRIRGIALVSVLAALMLTLLLEALDQTIVGTALPKIIGSLQGFDRYTWVVTAYLLGSTTMIPIVGKLSDQFGRKWFFVAGVITFLLGSALSGASQTIDQLIAFRALQGIGAGMGISLVFTVVGDIFPPAERARWQGIFSSVYGFSSVVGPTIGGWLADSGPLLGHLVTDTTRWRWVFYINLPLGLIALAALFIYLPSNISVRSSRYTGWAAVRRIDFLGAFFASSATISLLLGLTWGGNQIYDWNSPQVIIALVVAALLYISFIIAERFVAEPILPLDLFRNRVFAADSVLGLTSGMVLLSLVIYLPLYLQGVLGESATNSGEVITPLTISLVVGAALGGIVIARIGRYQAVTIAGAVLLMIGVFLMTLMSSSTSILEASRNMIIAGLGLGIFFSVVTLAVQNALPRTRLGVGTGAITYLRSVGQTLGVAITGSVVNNIVAADLLNHLPSGYKQLGTQGLAAATNQQVLINPDYRNSVIQYGTKATVNNAVPKIVAQTAPPIIKQSVAKAVQQAVAQAVPNAVTKATANVPPGPYHDQTVAKITAQVTKQVTDQVTAQVKAQATPKITQQVTHQITVQATTQITNNVHHLLQQVFDALRLSLAVGIERGFITVFVFCIFVFLASLFLKDVPLAKSYSDETSTMQEKSSVEV
jgi:EmrB/QacA subfamily drug resistance transporter